MNTIRVVLEYVTDKPPVPVIICAGSGRASDLISFAYQNTTKDGYANHRYFLISEYIFSDWHTGTSKKNKHFHNIINDRTLFQYSASIRCIKMAVSYKMLTDFLQNRLFSTEYIS